MGGQLASAKATTGGVHWLEAALELLMLVLVLLRMAVASAR